VLVLGCNGLLGQKVSEFLARGTPHQLVLSSRSEKALVTLPNVPYARVDIASRKSVRNAVAEWEPDVIVNAAAMTNVDACERERELAWKINVGGVENIIEASRQRDVKIIHVSTDYVFNGKDGPYSEDDRPDPLNYYGKSKLASENQLRASGLTFVIVRTIVLYGYVPGAKSNFALWLIQQFEQGLPVRVVSDQFGNPTLADDLAHAIVSAIDLGKSGVYHVGGRNIVSRHDFALEVAREFGFDEELISPIKTVQLRQPAQRPLKSGLITLKAEVELGYRPSTIEEGLTILKGQLTRGNKRMPDSAPVPGAGRKGEKR
jgi:dTDP-4-dehydrorhamnose reductase